MDGDRNEVIIQKNSNCLCTRLWEIVAKREKSSVWVVSGVFTGQMILKLKHNFYR